MSQKKTNTRRNDLILILLLLAVGAIATLLFLGSQKQGAQVVVMADGVVVESLPLNRNTEKDIVSINGINHLVIQDGKAWLESATCPDKLCVYQGKIELSGDCIVCLPNEVLVEIRDESNDLGLDAVAK